MRCIYLFLTPLLLLLSCNSQPKSTSSEAMQTAAYSRQMLSLPEEDVQLLKVHEPQLFKKIRDHIAMTIDDIISLQKLGFTSDIVIMIINYTESRFHLSTIDVLRLQSEGVPFKVINYMIRS